MTSLHLQLLEAMHVNKINKSFRLVSLEKGWEDSPRGRVEGTLNVIES